MKYEKLEELKKKFIGQTFNWLTVIDVYVTNCVMFKCKCKCGNISDVRKTRVINNKTKSCGCYLKSEEFAKLQQEHFTNNKELLKEISDRTKIWQQTHTDKVKEQAIKHSIYCKSNPNQINKLRLQHIKYLRMKRINNLHQIDLSDIHPDDVNLLLSGVTSDTFIRSKCQNCGNYSYHHAYHIINYTKHITRNILCPNCVSKLTASSYETEIVNFINTFYNDKLIKNCRNVISPYELDLYYPEKKIAIEFNGDYFHSNKFKDNTYHYNKFIKCKDKEILLVSIFESEWNKHKDAIKEYLKDLFNDKENSLSFNKDHTLMNNNYPSLHIKNNAVFEYVEDTYKYNKYTVFTCGYSKFV